MSVGWNFHTTYTSLPRYFYRRVPPAPASEPRFVLFNRKLAEELGLSPEALESPEGAAVLAGNGGPPDAAFLAMAYAGHQFGGFTMLGDGRALLLGEHVTPTGRRYDIQLKGSGPTPFSRGGDGRGALGPMLREYIVSEGMHGLGVPTSRSLAVVATGDLVYRDRPLPGAVLTRVAGSHVRVGTFQFAATWHGADGVKALADYTLQRHFPEETGDEGPYRRLLQRVAEGQADLLARWQLVGFVHGVMNTDNMSVAGETIDYGPCAFMDGYDPATVFSSIDRRGRYAYGNQPPIAQWNLARFAEALLPLLHPEEETAIRVAQDVISAFPDMFRRRWRKGMGAKLGLPGKDKDDGHLFEDMLRLMHRHGADYTNVFRRLTLEAGGRRDGPQRRREEGVDELWETEAWSGWKARWRARIGSEGMPAAHRRMKRVNPAVIPRNHRVEQALAAAEAGDLAPARRLLEVLADPYDYRSAGDEYASAPGPAAAAYVTFCGT